VADKPEKKPTREEVFEEVIEALSARYLPEGVKDESGGPPIVPVAVPQEDDEAFALPLRGLEQAGIGRIEVFLEVLRVELGQARRDIDRVEQREAESRSNVSEAQVYKIVLGIIGALVAIDVLMRVLG
jgi:hypothetical protein